MGNITVTAANVATVGIANVVEGQAAAAITAGQVVYKNTSGTRALAQSDGTAIESGTLGLGIAVNSAPGVGQRFDIQISGQFNPGGTAASGVVYAVSATAGLIALASDISSGQYMSILGVGASAAAINLSIYASGSTV